VHRVMCPAPSPAPVAGVGEGGEGGDVSHSTLAQVTLSIALARDHVTTLAMYR